jgi:hypothetical protein
MLLKNGRKSREIGAGTGIEASKPSLSHDYEIQRSGFLQRPILCPKLGALPIQIHQIFLAVDRNNGAGAVTGFHFIADLEPFLAREVGLRGLGSGWGGSGN